MSKCNFQYPFDELTGKVEHDKQVSTRILYNVKHTYFWHEDNEVKQTPNRVLHQFALKLANTLATEVMADPVKLQQARQTVFFPNVSRKEMSRLPHWRFHHLLVGYFVRDIKEKAQNHDAETIQTLMNLANEKAHADCTLRPNEHINSPKALALATFLLQSEPQPQSESPQPDGISDR